MPALATYRAQFRASPQLDKPYVMLGFNVFAAETMEEATLGASSVQQAFLNLRMGRPSQLPPPIEGYLERLRPEEKAILDQVLACAAIGPPAFVRTALRTFIARTQADELMITSQIFDHAARLRSYAITAQLLEDNEVTRA